MANSGSFKKGHKGTKPKGSKSRRTLEWEEFGRELLKNGMPRALSVMQSCPDQMFMNCFTSLLEYFKPKLSRVDNLDLKEKTPPLNVIQVVDTDKNK
jgi:hypothetical protein